MHAYCITGGTHLDRIKKGETLCRTWGAHPFDIFRLGVSEEKQSIGIDEIRLLCRTLSLSPRKSPVVVGIIDDAHRLTEEAQQALLKTLEEPPVTVRIILETDHASLLFPTIISRCQIIPLHGEPSVANDERKKIFEIIQSFHGVNHGEICHVADHLFSAKEEKLRFLDSFLCILHEELVASLKNRENRTRPVWKTGQILHMIRAVIKAQNQLSANINSSLVFDAFFFTISLYKPTSIVYN
jgi:hypothetical protein